LTVLAVAAHEDSTSNGSNAQIPVIPEVLWGARAALEALDIKTRDSG
jgi:hypothetical protein